MRSVRFRDVLHAVARKAGYSPESGNFITNQAIPIGEYISAWVDRLYSAEDWPEWTKVARLAPGSDHIVPYSIQNLAGPSISIWRVIDVYLLDPATVRNPPRTRFTLQEGGIHCGYEHGTYVWIKYIEPSPEFTAVTWRSDTVYDREDVVYSNQTGECYKSRVTGNLNHDPVGAATRSMSVDEIQPAEEFRTGQTVAVPKIMEVRMQTLDGSIMPDPHPTGGTWTVVIHDDAGAILGDAIYSNVAPETLASVVTNLVADLAAEPGLASFTITADTTNKKIVLQDESDFSVTRPDGIDPATYFFDGSSNQQLLVEYTVQPYIPATADQTSLKQQTDISIGTGDVVSGGVYTATFIDEAGVQHQVEYTALPQDGSLQILNGLAAAMGAAIPTDPFFEGTVTSVNPTTLVLTVYSRFPAGIDVNLIPPGSPYWDLVLFPEALFNPVVRGATADLLGEWGQSDKQGVEEGKVPQEEQTVAADFTTTPTAPLTTQLKPYSRYRY